MRYHPLRMSSSSSPPRAERRLGAAAAHVLATVVLWSVVPVVVKTLEPYSLMVALCRLLFAALALAMIQVAMGRRPFRLRGSRWLLLLGGAAMAGNYCLYNIGLKSTTASAANLVIQDEAVFLVLLAHWILKEAWDRWKSAGIALCTLGVLLVAVNGRPLSQLLRYQDLSGDAVVFVAGAFWAVYAICQRLLSRTDGTLDSLTGIFGAGTLCTALVVAGLGTGGPLPVPFRVLAWGAVLGSAVTGFSYVLLFRGISLSDVTTAGMMTTVLPLFTAVEAHFVLGDRITGWMGAGGALILAGLLLVARQEGPVEGEMVSSAEA